MAIVYVFVSPIFRPIPGIPGIPLQHLCCLPSWFNWSVMKGARENRRRDGQSLIIVALQNGSLNPLHQDLTASVVTVVEIRQEKIHGRRIQTSRPVWNGDRGRKKKQGWIEWPHGQICRLFRNQQEFPQLKYHPSIVWIPYSLVIKHGSNMACWKIPPFKICSHEQNLHGGFLEFLNRKVIRGALHIDDRKVILVRDWSDRGTEEKTHQADQ